MLFLGLFIAPNQKKLSGNPDWYIEWLGAVDLCIRLDTVFRSETPPPFCGNPPTPTWNSVGDENDDGTISSYHLSICCVSRGQSSDTQRLSWF